MIRSLIPFTQLTRGGVMPQFRVCRLPLVTQGVELSVGEVVAPDTFRDRVRVRQLYEQRRIEPVVAPKDSRQAARERMETEQRRARGETQEATPRGMTGDPSATAPAPVSVSPGNLFSSPAIPVGEEEEESAQPVPAPDSARPSGYTPRRTVRHP